VTLRGELLGVVFAATWPAACERAVRRWRLSQEDPGGDDRREGRPGTRVAENSSLDMTYPAMTTTLDRLAPFSRPAILEATRAVGLTDSELARLLNLSPVTVHDWTTGKRRFPPAKHHALVHFIAALAGILKGDLDPPPCTPAARSCSARSS
jgi:DNA-binding transcriptional regulator YiaG